MKGVALPPVRTLFLMLDCEFPPKTGTPQGIWRNMVALSKLGPIAVVSVGFNDYPEATLPGVERWIHIDKPMIQKRSAFATAFERLRRVFVPNDYPYCHVTLEKQAHAQLRQLIDEFQPTVAVIDHWLNAVIPAPLRHASFPVVVASHDVEWKLNRDLIPKDMPRRVRMRNYAENFYFRRVEARLYREADQTWAVSEHDRQGIQRFTGLTSEVRVLPAVMELDRYAETRQHTLISQPRTHGAPSLLYAGGYTWYPNVEAAHALIDDIYPPLRAMYPGTRLVLIGREPTEHMLAAAAADDNIVVTGEVEDVRPYLNEADIIPVPLLVGGGMRVKILEAFAAGVPVVSTTKGCEGINVQDGRELLVRDGAPGLVAGIAELWKDPERARTLTQNAFAFMQREHSMDLLINRMRTELQDLLSTRQPNR